MPVKKLQSWNWLFPECFQLSHGCNIWFKWLNVFFSLKKKNVADCWENVSGTKEGSSVFLDISEVFTCRWFPRLGFSSVHLQGLGTWRSPSFVAHMLFPAVFPSISVYVCHARPPSNNHTRTHWLQLWYMVNTLAFWIEMILTAHRKIGALLLYRL